MGVEVRGSERAADMASRTSQKMSLNLCFNEGVGPNLTESQGVLWAGGRRWWVVVVVGGRPGS